MLDIVAQIRELIGMEISLSADHFGHIGAISASGWAKPARGQVHARADRCLLDTAHAGGIRELPERGKNSRRPEVKNPYCPWFCSRLTKVLAPLDSADAVIDGSYGSNQTGVSR